MFKNCAYVPDSQEPAQRTYTTKEFLEFFMPSVQIELDPNEKEAVTHVYIRGTNVIFLYPAIMTTLQCVPLMRSNFPKSLPNYKA